MGGTEGFDPMDIPSSNFFWLVQPWKEGKLVTIDGWGRFAEISFVGANKLQIKPMVNFPRMKMDRTLLTWPEADLIASTSGKTHHLVAVDDKKTKSHEPYLSWVYTGTNPILLDPQERLVGYKYFLSQGIDRKLFVYDYKEDKIVFESPEDFTVSLFFAMNDYYFLSSHASIKWNKAEYKTVFYNWRTSEIVENDLTKALNQNRVDLLISPFRNIHTVKRNIFGYSRTIKQIVKVSWDEEYSDIKITPLNYLIPEGMILDDFTLSADGSWASTFVTGYRGLYNERLSKRAFFHLDERYSNGISIPVITKDYENLQRDYSAFVEHPVHGLCFAQEWHKNEKGKDKLYLRLYKMDDMLNEINRQLLERAREIAQ